MVRPILLTHWRSPGDIVLMTGAVRDLTRSHPGEFEVHIASSCPELWQNNPHITAAWGSCAPRHIPLFPVRYGSFLTEANAGCQHFLTAFHRALGALLGIEIPVLEPSGDLHLSVEEKKSARWVNGRYWLFIAGGKNDIQTKIWPLEHAQRFVDLLSSRGIQVVQTGATAPGHVHPKLTGVQDMVGRSNLRELMQLILHADGVICPVTCAMHMAAALQRPCVVIAGGREPPWWEWYQNPVSCSFGPNCASVKVAHRFLHTLGRFPCCERGGCWKKDLRPNETNRSHVCTMPVIKDSETFAPACLTEITPESVVDAVMSYYRDGTLESIEGAISPNGICRELV